jgi:hypothetical protein
LFGDGAATGCVPGLPEFALCPRPITQRPKAHIRRQGAAETISGATPIAVSQSHPSATPEPPTTSPAPAKTRRSRIQERTTSRGNVAVEQRENMEGWSHLPASASLSRVVALLDSLSRP